MVAKLDDLMGRSKAQERFHPPASFEHVIAHTNAMRQKPSNLDMSSADSSPNNDIIYTKPVVSMTYDYPSASFNSNPKSVANPPKSSNSFPMYSPSKLPDSYSIGSDSEGPPNSEYDSKSPGLEFDQPPKSIEFPGHYDRPFDDDPPYGQAPYHHSEIIFDHIPDDHHFHHHHHRPTTTMEPEMMDQRLNKRPYSYYYIGKKLWYIPLYFSIYFIIYIAALVLKSIARHKINFPSNLAAVAAGAENVRSFNQDGPGWMDYVVQVLEGIEKYGKMR